MKILGFFSVIMNTQIDIRDKENLIRSLQEVTLEQLIFE